MRVAVYDCTYVFMAVRDIVFYIMHKPVCGYLVFIGYLGHCLYLYSILCFLVTFNYNLLFPIF